MYERNHNKIFQLIDRNACLILNKIEDRFVAVKKIENLWNSYCKQFRIKVYLLFQKSLNCKCIPLVFYQKDDNTAT